MEAFPPGSPRYPPRAMAGADWQSSRKRPYLAARAVYLPMVGWHRRDSIRILVYATIMLARMAY
jgi:hypothetical protein